MMLVYHGLLNIAESVPVTLEKEPINEAFLFFNDWATGGGGTNADWFQDKPGYRNNAKLKGQTASFVLSSSQVDCNFYLNQVLK